MTSSSVTDSPFACMKIADFRRLDECEGRARCQRCSKSRKYFCYTCYCPLASLEKYMPNVKLPVKIDVIKHPLERAGKSTACHAVVISPEDVHIYTYPVIPEYDKATTVIVFPGEDSVRLQDCARCSEQEVVRDREDCERCDEGQRDRPTTRHHGDETLKAQGRSACPSSVGLIENTRPATPGFNKVIFIDSTWNQTYGIAHDERLQGIRKVELKQWRSNFWRKQRGKPDTYLATIEAIFHFVQDYHALFVGTPDNGQYDNLLFFFAYFHEKIQKVKSKGKLENGDVGKV